MKWGQSADRITFSGQFINALTTAVIDTGINIDTSTPANAGEMHNQRGVASFVGQALFSGSTLFNAQGGGFGGNNNAGVTNFANSTYRGWRG